MGFLKFRPNDFGKFLIFVFAAIEEDGTILQLLFITCPLIENLKQLT